MHISIMNGKKFYSPGDVIPEDIIVSDVPHGDFILSQGEYNPEGEEVLIDATAYNIARRFYDLNTQGYVLKAVIRDGYIIPILRNAKGQERYIYTKLIKPSPRHITERIGDTNLCWPTIERTWAEEKVEVSDSFIDEALNIIEEIGEDISEDFILPNELFEDEAKLK